jgi:hypothetical protein
LSSKKDGKTFMFAKLIGNDKPSKKEQHVDCRGPLMVFKPSLCFLDFYCKSWFLQKYCKKIVSLYVYGAIFVQMSLEAIQYPLPTALKDNQYPLSNGERVLATLWQTSTICKEFPIPMKNLSRVSFCYLIDLLKGANTF